MMSITGVIAPGFSPSSLIYELKQNKEECKMITLSSESETIAVSDKWAENRSVEWKVSLFNENASYHGLIVNYDDELNIDEKEVEVCLSGEDVGEYHGVLLLKEEQKGNTITQMGVWLKVNVTEAKQNKIPSTDNGDGSSSGGGGSKNAPVSQITPNVSEKPEIAVDKGGKVSDEVRDNKNIDIYSNAGITGAVIGSNKGNWKIIGIVIIALIIIGAIIYNKRKISEVNL